MWLGSFDHYQFPPLMQDWGCVALNKQDGVLNATSAGGVGHKPPLLRLSPSTKPQATSSIGHSTSTNLISCPFNIIVIPIISLLVALRNQRLVASSDFLGSVSEVRKWIAHVQ
jgi:hypothetical protein